MTLDMGTAFAPSAANRHRNLVAPVGSSVAASDIGSLKRRDIQEELKSLGVSYHDCFDKESLVHRLVEARETKGNVYEPASSTAATSKADAAPPSADEKLAELRAMSLKDLKLQCSRPKHSILQVPREGGLCASSMD